MEYIVLLSDADTPNKILVKSDVIPRKNDIISIPIANQQFRKKSYRVIDVEHQINTTPVSAFSNEKHTTTIYVHTEFIQKEN